MLSATSCSIQLPIASSPGSARIVSLSRPSRARAATAAPIIIGLLLAATDCVDNWRIRSSVRLSITSTSSPASTAGTTPKNDRAEYRPPISAGFSKTRAYARSTPIRARLLPGSVIATKFLPGALRPAIRHRDQKYAPNACVSRVSPDLLATITPVRERLTSSATRSTATGSVLSSTTNCGDPDALGSTSPITSGARLLPPIPSNTMWDNPDLNSSAHAVNSGRA